MCWTWQPRFLVFWVIYEYWNFGDRSCKTKDVSFAYFRKCLVGKVPEHGFVQYIKHIHMDNLWMNLGEKRPAGFNMLESPKCVTVHYKADANSTNKILALHVHVEDM